MSEYIYLGNIPSSPEERQRLLAEREAREALAARAQLTQVQQRVLELLTGQKGYALEDIEVNKEFTVEVPEGSFSAATDFILLSGDKRFMAITCIMSSPESWERRTVAFCRVAGPCQIPWAVVTDSESARMLNALTGTVLSEGSEGMEVIPSKEEAARLVIGTAFVPYPSERAEREKRILYAFEAIKCGSKPDDLH